MRLRRGGFTLIELLAVLVILTILGGLTAGVYQVARRNYSLAASASSVEALIVRARNTAITAGIPTRVVIGPAATPDGLGTWRVTAWAFETLGEWSFEGDGTRGLFNEKATFRGAQPAGGRVGQGVDLSGGPVDCGVNPRHDARLGLHAEAWVLLEAELADPRRVEEENRGTARRSRSPASEEIGAVPVISKGKAFSLGVAPDGALEGAIGAYRVRTDPGVVVPGLWTLIALRHDDEGVRLSADGIERPSIPVGYENIDPKKRPPPPDSVPLDASPLLIGGKGGFPGRVDEVRLRGLIEPQEYELGPREKVLGWKKEIRFDRNGHLDPRFHEKPVRILLYHEALEEPGSTSGRTAVFIDYSKTFDAWARSRGLDLEKEGISEEGEEQKLENGLEAGAREEIIIDRIGSVR